ncbi:MAG: MATE family efflux transporter [Rhodanobacter sp.]
MIFAGPLSIANLFQTASTVVIFIFLGHLGSGAVAGAALAVAIFTPCAVFLSGLVSVVVPLLAELQDGGPDMDGARARLVGRVMGASLILALAIVALFRGSTRFFTWTGQDPHIAVAASAYLAALQWSLPIIVCTSAVRTVVAVQGKTKSVVLSAASVLVVNGVLCCLVSEIHRNIPLDEPVAIAWVNVLGNLAGLVALWRPAAQLVRQSRDGRASATVYGAGVIGILRLGLPAAFIQWLQVCLFNVWFFFIGAFDRSTLAAFALSSQATSLAFVAVAGCSQAIAIRVATSSVQQDISATARHVRGAAITVGSFIGLYAFGTIAFFEGSALLELDHGHGGLAVQVLGILPFTLPLLALDAVQILETGILRGLKSTFVPLKISLIGNLAVGVPVALYVARRLDSGAIGILLGALLGAFLSVVALAWNCAHALNREVVRASAGAV